MDTLFTEPVLLNVYGAPELIPRNEFRQPMYLAGRYDNPIPPRCLAPIDSLKIPAQYAFYPKMAASKGRIRYLNAGKNNRSIHGFTSIVVVFRAAIWKNRKKITFSVPFPGRQGKEFTFLLN